MVKYLESIGLAQDQLKRSFSVINFLENEMNVRFSDLFVSECLRGDDEREFLSMFFFGGDRIVEAKNFLEDDCYENVYYDGKNRYWRLQKKNYDFKSATNNSSMIISVEFIPGVSCELSATDKVNCEKLKNVFMRFILQS